MKKKLLTILCFGFILIFVTSCMSSNINQTQSATVNASPVSVATTALNQLATTENLKQLQSDVLPSPTKIIHSTQTPNPTLTSAPDIESTQQATWEAAGQIVEDLMKPDVFCQLPCWWGIELGDSLENVEKKVRDLGINSWEVTASDFGDMGDRGYVRTGYYNNETLGYDVSTTIKIYTVEGVVHFMNILAERPLPQYGKQEFVRDWQAYDISSILKQYGKPSHVYLASQNVSDQGLSNFSLILYYPDLGLNFTYRPYDSTFDETTSELCLDLANMRQINLSLYDPEYVNTWFNYLVPPASNPEMEGFFEQSTWEEQTGMDLDDFYRLFEAKDKTNVNCIQITR